MEDSPPTSKPPNGGSCGKSSEDFEYTSKLILKEMKIQNKRCAYNIFAMVKYNSNWWPNTIMDLNVEWISAAKATF